MHCGSSGCEHLRRFVYNRKKMDPEDDTPEQAELRRRSGGTLCCVPGCRNNTRFGLKISWHCFPSDEQLRSEWLKRLDRPPQKGVDRWEPTKCTRICGIHFNITGKKTYDDKLPIYFPNKIYAESYKRRYAKAEGEGIIYHNKRKENIQNVEVIKKSRKRSHSSSSTEPDHSYSSLHKKNVCEEIGCKEPCQQKVRDLEEGNNKMKKELRKCYNKIQELERTIRDRNSEILLLHGSINLINLQTSTARCITKNT